MRTTPPGPVASGGNTPTRMGTWSLLKPVLRGKCNFCLLCWIYCPDGSIYQDEASRVRIDHSRCKGCGICARECPLGTIKMVELTPGEQDSAR